MAPERQPRLQQLILLLPLPLLLLPLLLLPLLPLLPRQERQERFSQHEPDACELVSPAHAAAQLRGATPGFWERVGPANLSARGARSPDHYLEMYEASMVPPARLAERDRTALLTACRAARAALSASADRELAAFPWRLVCSAGRRAENGYAHTVGDTIVIPLERLEKLVGLQRLLVHEAAHVWQRNNPNEADARAEAMGFRRAGVEGRGYEGEARANPDTDTTVWTYGGVACRPILVKGAASIADVRRRRYAGAFGNTDNHEHPYEVMAEAAATRHRNVPD